MYSYNADAEEIFDAWTSGTVIGSGKTLEAYYTVCLNGNGKYVDFQGNTPTSGYTIERVIWVKSDGLADHTSTSGWTSPSALQPTASTSLGPTIAECWVAINAYLTKFSGSQNNFTFLISYDETINSYTGLLDDYSGAAAAYSLRLLDSGYSGDAVRVRRASDNTEQDIGFDAYGDLDTSALATFCSGTNGFVKTWYDQSGNANDATQTTTANQPKIYDSSTGVVEKNGKPAFITDGVDDALIASINCASNFQLTLVGAPVNTSSPSTGGAYGYFANLASTNDGVEILNLAGSLRFSIEGDDDVLSGTLDEQSVALFAYDGSNKYYSINALETIDALSTTVAVSANIEFGTRLNINPLIAYYQEFTLWNASTQIANREDILTNINDYYVIY